MSTRVYIASPYTLGGDKDANVRVQIDAYHTLRDAGLFPFAPLLSHYLHLVRPRDYEDWMEIDLYWLFACDLLVRLPGDSLGADQEVAYAKTIGIPVVYSLDEAIAWHRELEP
jgi:hypothetical protein